MEEALAGVRVLDLTQALAGPYATMLLADLGAEVIKIERPGSRRQIQGPFSYRGMDAYFIGVNRNKKSVALDLKHPRGREVFYDLVRVSDVVMDNFRPGVTKKLGVDYESLSAINPRIICTSITGYGSVGPYRHRPAYDLVVQAISGAISITGHPGQPPARNGVAVADQGAGFVAAAATIAALYRRQQTGRGQKVETSLLEAMMYQLAYEIALYTISGIMPEPIGCKHQMVVPYNVYQGSDGRYFALAAPFLFRQVCEAIGRPELVEDERFNRPDRLLQNREALEEELSATFRTRPAHEWVRILQEADIPCGPVNKLQEAIDDPQVQATQMVVSVPHVLGGEVRLVGVPVQMSGTSHQRRHEFTSPPTLGQHTEEVLTQVLGYGRDRIEELRSQGVIG